MSNSSDDSEAPMLRAHPLAISLVARLRSQPHARVLEIGSGSGRNTQALRAAGLRVEALPDDADVPLDERVYDGALSTHAFLHGTPGTIAARLDAVARSLKQNAPFHATFGSTHDARFGKGLRISKHVFAPEKGDEKDVPHVYFNRADLEALLEPYFFVESIQETAADEIIGRWAHREPLQGVMHWFVRALKSER